MRFEAYYWTTNKDHSPIVIWNIAFIFWRLFMLFCTSVKWLL